MNKIVNLEVDKIFNAFNDKFFDNKLPLPFFKFEDIERSILNTNIVAKNNDKYSHEIRLPISCLNKTIDILALYVLEGMIREWAYINDEKLFSNRGVYANKKFAEKAKSFGLTVSSIGGSRGFIVKTNDNFKHLCEDCGFSKTWGKIYEYNNGKQKSSTVKYIDPLTGESVRGTKDHFLICFDECPEIGEQVEKMFNKKRMVLED